jgi:hypothetical protein
MVASLIWPYTLPSDLSVEWDALLVHSVLQLGQMVHNGIEHGWFHLQPEVFPPERTRKIMTLDFTFHALITISSKYQHNNKLKNINTRACFKKASHFFRTPTNNFSKKGGAKIY